MSKSTLQQTILRYREGEARASDDAILVESPLELIVNSVPYAALMCTPGSDIELALGFCMTERLISADEECLMVSHTQSATKNSVHLAIAGGPQRVNAALAGRKPLVGVSCCGNRSATSHDNLVRSHLPASTMAFGFALHPSSLHSLQKEAEACQQLFSTTGATHFCALYDDELSLIAYAEDVGRHNALDKAVGQSFRGGVSANTRLVLLSSRVSFEMVQKAISVRAQVVAGFSAVTSAAVELAREAGITLVGFLRPPRCNIYTHPERLGFTSPAVVTLPKDKIHNLYSH